MPYSLNSSWVSMYQHHYPNGSPRQISYMLAHESSKLTNHFFLIALHLVIWSIFWLSLIRLPNFDVEIVNSSLSFLPVEEQPVALSLVEDDFYWVATRNASWDINLHRSGWNGNILKIKHTLNSFFCSQQMSLGCLHEPFLKCNVYCGVLMSWFPQ